MSKRTKKGHVEFKQPSVKLVADMPEDQEVREHMDEMKSNDGYEGSCVILTNGKKDSN
jgi:hypothetical protein